MARRVLVALVAAACLAAIVGFQSTRVVKAASSPRVFVPSPRFYLDFSPSFRTSIADAYWLYTVQYYGEHLNTDQRFDSLGPMLDLVTSLSPHFRRAYYFGAFALIDARRPDVSYELLKRGYTANPGDWHFPYYLGFFAYTFGPQGAGARAAAAWYSKAAETPGRPDFVPRLAAVLFAKGGEKSKAIAMWASVYTDGDKYSRARAVKEIGKLLPAEKQARMKAVAKLRDLMPPVQFDQLVADLFPGYY